MRLNKSIRSFRLLAFLVAVFAVSVPIASSSPGSNGDFSPISLLKRIPEVFQARWVFSKPSTAKQLNFQADLEVSESQHTDYTTMDRKMHPPPAPRRRTGRQLQPTQPPPKKVQEDSEDMETAADSPPFYVVDYLHSHGPPYHHAHHHHHGPPKGYPPKGHPPKYSYAHYKAEPKAHYSYGHIKSEPKATYSYGHHKSHPPKYHGHSYVHSPPTYHHYTDDHSSYFELGGGEGAAPPGAPPGTIPEGTPEEGPPASSGPPETSPGDPPGIPGPQGDLPGDSPNAQCAAEIGDKNITKPADLETSWFLIDDQRTRVDPLIILNPPLVLVPPSPEQISTDALDTYESTYVERLSMDFEESAKNAGFSIVRDRVTSLNISTVLPKQPETSGDSVTSVVTIRRLPRLDAPLKGRYDPKGYFVSALRAEMQRRRNRETTSPIKNFILSDLHTMTNLFQELWDFEMKPEEIEVDLLASKNEKVDVLQMPMMISRSERLSIPEPDHSERTILDASFNFGLPASSLQFESHSRVVEDWKQMVGGVGRAKFLTAAEDLFPVYSGMAQFYESLEDFVRTRIVFQRNFGEESFIRAEALSQSSFNVRQFLICLDRDNDPSCESHCAVDPGQFENMLADGKSGSGGGMRPRPRPPTSA